MQAVIRHAARVLLLVSLAVVTGCAAFPAEKLKASAIPEMAGAAYRPSAYLEVKFFQGKPGASGAVEIPGLKSKVEAAVTNVLSANSPFSRYTFDQFEQEKVDQIVQLHYYNHGEAGAGVLLGLICGFTFGVIPAVATDNYTLLASVKPKGAPAAEARRSDDSVTTWMGLIFIPFSGKTPEKAVSATLEDLTRDGLRQLIEANQLRPKPIATEATAPAATGTPAPSPQQ